MVMMVKVFDIQPSGMLGYLNISNDTSDLPARWPSVHPLFEAASHVGTFDLVRLRLYCMLLDVKPTVAVGC